MYACVYIYIYIYIRICSRGPGAAAPAPACATPSQAWEATNTHINQVYHNMYESNE